jgi:organic radical activating enzyme
MPAKSQPAIVGNNPIPLDQDLTVRIRQNGFIDHCLTVADGPDLARFIRKHRASVAECFPLFAALSNNLIGSFASLTVLYAAVHGSSKKPSSKCTKVMRDMLLSQVDRRLQNIYRNLFFTNPPKWATSHAQRLAMLQTTRNDVEAVLGTYDWRWLARWLDVGHVGETADSCLQRLGNFALPINKVCFLFTHHCNISCRHCYNNSGPQLKAKRIRLDRMLKIVAEMPGAGIPNLAISGGEPFLYRQDVLAMVKAGRAAGLKQIEINTNGFWASTDEQANKVLDQLAEAGFMQGFDDRIKLSSGSYHQEFIAFDRTLILARNFYARFGRPLFIDFELTPKSDHSAGEIRKQIDAAGLTDRVRLTFREIASVGRGKDIEGISRNRTNGPCVTIDIIMINPDESVLPCDGLNHENHGLRLGRADRHHLRELVKRMQNDPILQFLAAKPLNELLPFIGKTERPDGYGGICDQCQHAIGELTDREPLRAALFEQQHFYPFWFTLS